MESPGSIETSSVSLETADQRGTILSCFCILYSVCCSFTCNSVV